MGSKFIESIKIKAKKILGYATWILVLFLLISAVRNIKKVASIRSEVEKEKEKVQKMHEENAQIETQIAQTQGSDFIDKQIRDKLGLVKRGEAIVVLPDEDVLRKSAPQMPVEENTLPDPNWKRWEKLFF